MAALDSQARKKNLCFGRPGGLFNFCFQVSFLALSSTLHFSTFSFFIFIFVKHKDQFHYDCSRNSGGQSATLCSLALPSCPLTQCILFTAKYSLSSKHCALHCLLNTTHCLLSCSLAHYVLHPCIRVNNEIKNGIIIACTLIIIKSFSPRSGAEQLRWRLTNINRAFCPKTVCKRDKGRVLVIITHRYLYNDQVYVGNSYNWYFQVV